MSKRKPPLPAFVGRKACGCVVAASVGDVPAVTLGLTWERVPDGEEVNFSKCDECEVKK